MSTEERLAALHAELVGLGLPCLVTGGHGGATVAFLGVSDLIRSKETEREEDWRDVALLEEVADERRLSAAPDTQDVTSALRELRSRRGFARALATGHFSRRECVAVHEERMTGTTVW